MAVMLNTRPRHEDALDEALAALREVVAARDKAVKALTALGDAFAGGDFAAELERPCVEVVVDYRPETLALWEQVSWLREHLNNESYSQFDFDDLLGQDSEILTERFDAWLAAEGAQRCRPKLGSPVA